MDLFIYNVNSLCKKILFLVVFTIVKSVVYGQSEIGIEAGLNQHAAGGGPFIGVVGKSNGFRYGFQLLTQINTFTPYKFEPYNDYRFAGKVSQFFGGGINLGYEFKHTTTQKVKPLLMYRSGYFYSGYGKIGKDIDVNGNVDKYFLYSSASSFSCTQNVAAGIAVSFGKNFYLDLTLGTGLYIFRDRYFWKGSFSTHEEPYFEAKTVVRPDLNANLSLQYRFRVK